MKTVKNTNKEKVPSIRIDSSLDKYDKIILFPEKLAAANSNLKKAGFPKLSQKTRSR
jgi:hypothetical protein